MIRAIVTDIEGTTSDIRFVHQVLFPYARERLADFVRHHAAESEVAAPLAALRAEIDQPQADLDALIAALYRFMDEDRIPACHAGGRGFEPRPFRHYSEALS